jgi:hypothetical protein
MKNIDGEVASPAELKKQIEELKADLKEKFHATEQSRLYNRSLLTFVLGLVGSIAVAIAVWVFIKPTFDRPTSANGSGPTTSPGTRPLSHDAKTTDPVKDAR